ncbi:unnamed protein product [Rotaria sordida]|uniref:Cytidyltransferase-like domain-containing protein n=1 Tax=Rotaria sordida TaxID=392033 RepID=A0A815FTA9_9BILA|nr:unnamed protein product [Rotaria sordida]CAF3871445.1 unnamed protein product [Rotaria sordida]
MIRLGSNVLLHGDPPGQQKKISHDDGRRGSGDSDRGKEIHLESTTDLSIIYSNLNKSKSNKENIILISTGAMNPIHRCHISNMIKTKQYLENIHDYNVIAGYISPTHDEYVQEKLGNYFIPSHHRINMCQKAIQEENQQD